MPLDEATSEKLGICVIIAAYNASATIERAVQSALLQNSVTEVVVVDDCSSDATARVAAQADDGTDRLRVIKSPANLGPAAARNLALDTSSAPLIALLDADDFYLEGRFEAMLAVEGWDLIADNIAFIGEHLVSQFRSQTIRKFEPKTRTLSLAEFVEGNISRPGGPRAELGFLKPVIRRSAMLERRIRYDERLRLGEDFALYAQLLREGAVFKCIRSCGYVAVERSNSLSGKHNTGDLAALLDFDQRFIKSGLSTKDNDQAMARHIQQLREKHYLRVVLDHRKTHGRLRAAIFAAMSPRRLPGLFKSVARDSFQQVKLNYRRKGFAISSDISPKVSIIIACYNAERYIAGAIRSALEQSVCDIEVIVIDDCSTDASVGIVNSIAANDPRLRLILAKQNGGPAVARNLGLSVARGEWIGILDADDIFAPQRIYELLQMAETMAVDIVADNLLVFYDDHSLPPHKFLSDESAVISVSLMEYLQETVMFGNGADYGFLKPLLRHDFLKFHTLNYDTSLRIGEDDDLILRMLLKDANYLIHNQPNYAYRKHVASISHRLPSAAASAMETAARRLETVAKGSKLAKALRRRRRAFGRARVFAELVRQLKDRNICRFAVAVVRNPGAVALLRMPLLAAIRRKVPSAKSGPKRNIPTEGVAISEWQQVLRGKK